MALKDDQIKWMRDLSGNKAKIVDSADVQSRKDGLLAEVFKELDGRVHEIKLGEDYVMTMKNTGLGGFLRATFKASPKTMKAIGKDGNPDDSFDTGHDLEDAAGLTPEQATQLTKAHAIIIEQVEKLRKEKDGAGKPLFTDVEISQEIFQPLMRRKLIPENAISDRYSEVTRTFDSASEQYNVRLEAYAESVNSNEGLAAKLGLGSEGLKSAGGMANNLMKLLSATGAIPKDFDLSTATDICTATTTTLSAPLDIAQTVLKDGGLNAKSVQNIAKTVIGNATSWVTSAFDIKFSSGSDQDDINKQLGKAINAGLTLGLSSVSVCAKLAGGGNAKDALADLADIVEQCLVCAGAGGAYKNNVEDKGALAELGRHLKSGILGGAALIDLAKIAESKDPAGELLKALQSLLQVALQDGATTYKDKREKELRDAEDQELAQKDKTDPEGHDKRAEELKQQRTDRENFDLADQDEAIKSGGESLGAEKFDIGEMMKLAQTLSKEDLEKKFEEDPALKQNKSAQALMLKINEQKQKDLEAAVKTVDEEVAKDEAAFRALLNGSGADEASDEIDNIELLILQIKKDQMIQKMAENLIKMPAAAVASFLPPASMAVDAINLATSMRKAAKHIEAWLEWEDNVTDAKSAMSVQVSAMANRAGISQGQAARKGMEALEAAISLIGNALGTAGGPFAPIGIGVSKGVAIASSLKDLILKVYDERQLSKNWELYKKALDNPGDRKGIRSAIKGNATLAKYVIAYGAVVGGDPVAKNALQKCGLNEKVLQSPKTNEQKVVTYLETLYADDPVVLDVLDAPAKWHPGPVELSGQSIAAFSQAGVKKARPPFAAPIPPALIRAAMDLGPTKDKLTEARKKWRAAGEATPPDEEATKKANIEYLVSLRAYHSAIGSVVVAMTNWQPTTANGQPHDEGVEYKARLNRMVRGVLKQAKKEMELYDAEG